jgi:hypothetical protein
LAQSQRRSRYALIRKKRGLDGRPRLRDDGVDINSSWFLVNSRLPVEGGASATCESRIRFDAPAVDAREALAQSRSLVGYMGLLELLAEQVVEQLELSSPTQRDAHYGNS